MIGLDERRNESCFSSEVKVSDINCNERSIKYIIAVQDRQKCNLLEYIVKWNVDKYDNFYGWKDP